MSAVNASSDIRHATFGSGQPADGTADTFSWQVYTPCELAAFGSACGLETVLACSGFDEDSPPSPTLARMQLVLVQGDARGRNAGQARCVNQQPRSRSR